MNKTGPLLRALSDVRTMADEIRMESHHIADAMKQASIKGGQAAAGGEQIRDALRSFQEVKMLYGSILTDFDVFRNPLDETIFCRRSRIKHNY